MCGDLKLDQNHASLVEMDPAEVLLSMPSKQCNIVNLIVTYSILIYFYINCDCTKPLVSSLSLPTLLLMYTVLF